MSALYPTMLALATALRLPRSHRDDLEQDRRELERLPPDTPVGWILYADGTHLVRLDASRDEREAVARTAHFWPDAHYFILEPDAEPEALTVGAFAARVRAGLPDSRFNDAVPPSPWTREMLQAWFAADGADEVTRENGGVTWRGFLLDANRYRFDFGPCKGPNWHQYDTDQDAWYFGVWVNLAELVVVTFAEGDLSIWVADDGEALAEELRRMSAFYGDAPPAMTVIEPETGKVTVYYDERPGVGE